MWNDAFKWSSQYLSTDPETRPKFKPLSKEDFEFLEKAFESVTINETKEFIECFNKLQESNNEDDSLCWIDKMINYINGLEVSRNIVRMKRFKDVISFMLNEKNQKIKIQLIRLVGSMMQNDLKVQEDAVTSNIFECLDYLKIENYKGNVKEVFLESRELIEKILFLICGLVYGECIISREMFVCKYNGYLLLKDVYSILKTFRVLKLFEDLTKPEDSKQMIPLSKMLVENFISNKIHDYCLELLLESFLLLPNGEYEIKEVLYNILQNISYLWSEDDYKNYNEVYRKVLEMSLTKSISNEDIKELIRNSNEKIVYNYKNKQTFIQQTGSITSPESEIKIEEKPDGGKILCLK